MALQFLEPQAGDDSAPKWRNSTAQANGLGLDYPAIAPSPERAGYRWTRIQLPVMIGTYEIEKDCSAPSGLGG